MRMLILLIATMSPPGCLGCGGGNGEPAPVIRPQAGRELCGQACKHAADLSCVEGTPVVPPTDILTCDGGGCPQLVACDADGGTPACVSCEWFCQYQHDNGVSWNTSCVVGVVSCLEIETVCNK